MLTLDVDPIATHMREAWGSRADALVWSYSLHKIDPYKVSVVTSDSRVYTGVVTKLSETSLELTNGMNVYALDNDEVVSAKVM